MQRYPDYTRVRLAQLADRIRGKIYSEIKPVNKLLVSERVDRISYDEAQELSKFKPAKIGQQFGPLWATYWFRVTAQIPADWAGSRVDLLWVSHSEATLWIDGKTVQGLNYDATGWDKAMRPDAILLDRAKGDETVELQIEMACNRPFGDPGPQTPKPISPYVLEQCDIARFDPLAWEMYHDFRVLSELEAEQDKEPKDLDNTWAGELLYELNRFANALDLDDRATWKKSMAILKPLFNRKNGTRVHELSAIGHAHIDTAWLWPLAETNRKCDRTFSTATTYMADYPEYRFSCSQAYQYQAIKDRNPDLYKRIQKRVKTGQWVPVGGTWIEPDCNIPSGEALCRQFLHGQRFFEKEFGKRCKEFWNPDVFGYNGQLPQIMKLAGIKRFLTQKLSWNRFNKPHHHTFLWQGIDGTEVLAHFPPADTYNAMVSVNELRRHARAYKDHDRSRHAMLLFGYGDGGGGPTKVMLETLRRVKDLQGVPRAKMRTSEEFFDLLERDGGGPDGSDWPKLVGELYFEYHRGTYTTQAAVKRGNRKSEFLLHDCEFLSTIAAEVTRGKRGASANRDASFRYPGEELDALWKLVLLNQFHDILPGSSITLVYDDAAEHYAEIASRAEAVRDAAAGALVGSVTAKGGKYLPINTIGFARAEVAKLPSRQIAFVEAPSYGIGRVIENPPDEVTIETNAKSRRTTLRNAHLEATLDAGGRLISLIERSTGRETMAGAGNAFKIYDDQPTNFEAWDVDPYHMETERDCGPANYVEISGSGSSLRREIAFEYAIGKKSKLKQIVRLDAGARRLEFICDVDWHENQKMLKVVFPVNIRAMNATYEMQFGSVERPTHFNTMYDLARYEVPGHKWSDLSEHGFGVALLSESKYGYSTFDNIMRLSLLRSPKSPDPKADMGRHRFAYAIMPHAGGWREAGVVAEALRFNVPLIFAPGEPTAPRSFASVDDANLVLDTIKRAEDSDEIVLRLFECHGSRGTARVTVDLPFKSASFCNVLEETIGRPARVREGAIEVPYEPFQIISLKLKR